MNVIIHILSYLFIYLFREYYQNKSEGKFRSDLAKILVVCRPKYSILIWWN